MSLKRAGVAPLKDVGRLQCRLRLSSPSPGAEAKADWGVMGALDCLQHTDHLKVTACCRQGSHVDCQNKPEQLAEDIENG